MAETLHSKWRGIALVAAVLALSSLARLPYLRQGNLSPDAADYMNIARNIARGRGPIHSIKWHFFTAHPAIHSAIGERPLLYPLLLVPFCRGDYPARACQYVTLLMTVAALGLAAAWARHLGFTWRPVAIGTVLLAFNPGLAMNSVYPLTEPLYLVWLFGLLLIVGRDNDSPRAARVAGLLTALAYLTRPSAAAIAIGLSLWYVYRRAFPALANYLLTLALLLIPWWAIVWAVRGNPFYSVQGFHLLVSDIRDGMAAGYGVVFPRPLEFLSAHAPTVLSKAGAHTIAYVEQLFGPIYLSLLSVFVFLRLARRRSENRTAATSSDGPCYAIALCHFALLAMTWATFDYIRFMAPCFALFVVPAVAEMDDWVGRLAARRLRVAAWLLVLGAIGFIYFDEWAQLYRQVIDGRRQDLSMQVARIEFDRIVAANATVVSSDPFSCNYYFDRPTIILPDAPDSAQRMQLLERFLDEYRPDYLVLKRIEAKTLSPLIERGRLRPAGILGVVDLHIFRVISPFGATADGASFRQ